MLVAGGIHMFCYAIPSILFILIFTASFSEASASYYSIQSLGDENIRFNTIKSGLRDTFINSLSDDFYRIDYLLEESTPSLYVYLNLNDTITISYDAEWNRITFNTRLQELAEFSEITSGYFSHNDVFDLLNTVDFASFKHLSDSITTAKLGKYKILKAKFENDVNPVYWEAEYCNIVLFPLVALNYRLNSEQHLALGREIISGLPYIKQIPQSKILVGATGSYVKNYISKTYHIDIKDTESYYKYFKHYFSDKMAVYQFSKEIIARLDQANDIDELNKMYASGKNIIKNEIQLFELDSIYKEVHVKMNHLKSDNLSIFFPAFDINGNIAADEYLKSRKTYLFISSSGCPPCMSAANWMIEHYSHIKGQAQIVNLVIGKTEHYKNEQSISPYPWPVYYDDTGSIRQHLIRKSVPQFFIIENGSISTINAPRPEDYFKF